MCYVEVKTDKDTSPTNSAPCGEGITQCLKTSGGFSIGEDDDKSGILDKTWQYQKISISYIRPKCRDLKNKISVLCNMDQIKNTTPLLKPKLLMTK